MKILITILLLIGSTCPQDFASLNLQNEVVGEFDFMRVDNFGKIYLVKNDEVFQYNQEGIFLNRNSNKLFGSVTDLDVTNGLEISAFFQDQIQIVFLDNQLALKGREIPLDEMELDQISEICTSHGNGLWLFDQVKMELVRIDKNNKHIANSGNLRQLLGFSPDPIYMREVNNWLYVNDSNKGILVFDIFGSYYKTIPIKRAQEFQVKGSNIIYYNEPYLINFDMVDLEFDTVMNLKGGCKQVLIGKNQLNILYDNKLSIFTYNP